MADISEIEEALIPRLVLCLRVAKKKSPFGYLALGRVADHFKLILFEVIVNVK